MSTLDDNALWDDEWALSTLLHEGEVVINKDHLDQVKERIEHLIERAKYYGENKNQLEFLEDLLDDLKFIEMGSRP